MQENEIHTVLINHLLLLKGILYVNENMLEKKQVHTHMIVSTTIGMSKKVGPVIILLFGVDTPFSQRMLAQCQTRAPLGI